MPGFFISRRRRPSRVLLLPFFFCAVLLASPPPRTPAPPSLASRVETLMSDPAVAQAFWGIEVEELGRQQPVLVRNSEKLFTPASNTKLFTTATALGLLGPDFRFHTTVESHGKLDNSGRLSSDLILVGRGDPNLSGRNLPYELKTERDFPPERVLQELADQVAATGIKEIDGDIVGDDSYYSFERFGEGWSQDDLLWDYGAAISALSLNDNVIFLSIDPAPRSGLPAVISLSPTESYYQIDDRVLTTASGLEDISLNREPGSRQVQVWGTIPRGNATYHESLAVEDPAEWAAVVFRRLLEARGIKIRGVARAQHADITRRGFTTKPGTSASAPSSLPSPATAPSAPKKASTQAITFVLASHESLPLIEDVRVTNKVSQNLHAELLLRLAAAVKGSGTFGDGVQAVRDFVQGAGISPSELVFFDGSGLSRGDLVTPDAIVKLLQFIARQPWGSQFQTTLPTAGVDGSLATRLASPLTLGRVHAKTGSLGHVSALSGYAVTTGGKQMVFSIIANNHHLGGKGATDVIDKIVEAIVDDKHYSRP